MGKLTTEEKIEELKKLLDSQTDDALLDEIYALLKPEINPILKEKLTARALRANDDIANGRVHAPEEVLQQLNKLFEK